MTITDFMHLTSKYQSTAMLTSSIPKYCCCSVRQSYLFSTPWWQHARLPCPSLSPEVHSKTCPLTDDAIQPSHPLYPLSPPAFNLSKLQDPFQWKRFFASGGQSTGPSASGSVLPVTIQGWFPSGLTGLISLPSKGLSRSSATPQFKSINSLVLSVLYGPALTSIHDYCKNYSLDYKDFCQESDVFAF